MRNQQGQTGQAMVTLVTGPGDHIYWMQYAAKSADARQRAQPGLMEAESSFRPLSAADRAAAKPWSVAVIPETNQIFVTSQEAGTLSIIDGSNYGVVATLPVGVRPCGVAANPRSRRVYVTSPDSSSVTIIPPSPVVIGLEGVNEKIPMRPSVPVKRPPR